MLQALALAGLSAGGSLLSSIGAGNASAKQGRLQMMEDARARVENEAMLGRVNAQRYALGRELADLEETSTTTQSNFTQRGGGTKTSGRTWGDVDVDGMMAAAERAGFNPATFLNAGALQYYARSWQESETKTDEWQYDTQTNTVKRRGHNLAEAFKMMLPEYALGSPSQVPQQSSMLSALGGALSAGTSAFGTQLRADQSYDLQLAKMLGGNALQGMGLSDGNGFSQVIRSGGSPIGVQRSAGMTGGAAGPGMPPSMTLAPGSLELPYFNTWGNENGKDYIANPHFGAFVDGTISNTDVKEKRYGEPGDWLFGIDTMVHDGLRNITGRNVSDWGRAAGMNIGDYKAPADTSWGPSFGRWWSAPTSLPNARLPGFSGNAEGYFPFPGSSPLN